MLNEQTSSDLLALRQSYEREGYVVIRNALDPSELDPMRERVTKGVDAFARELRAKGEIESLYENCTADQQTIIDEGFRWPPFLGTYGGFDQSHS